MSEETPTSVQTLLGEIAVPLEQGGVVHVTPWGIRTARRMTDRMKTLLQIATGAAGGNLDINMLITHSFDEVLGIVSDTLDISIDELEDENKYLLADLLALADAIIRINFIERPGLVKNFNALLSSGSKMFGEEGSPDEKADDSPQVPESANASSPPAKPRSKKASRTKRS